MSIQLLPRISEKAYASSVEKNVYVFDVDPSATKLQIASEVERQFTVSVSSVRTQIAKGKAKRMFTKRGRSTTGRRSDVKRAYVSVKQGDHIPVFAALDESDNKSSKKKKEKK